MGDGVGGLELSDQGCEGVGHGAGTEGRGTRHGKKSGKGDGGEAGSGFKRTTLGAMKTRPRGRREASRTSTRAREASAREASRASTRGGTCVYRSRARRISVHRGAKTIGLPYPARTAASVVGAQRGQEKNPRIPETATSRWSGRQDSRGGRHRKTFASKSRIPRANGQVGLAWHRRVRRSSRSPRRVTRLTVLTGQRWV